MTEAKVSGHIGGVTVGPRVSTRRRPSCALALVCTAVALLAGCTQSTTTNATEPDELDLVADVDAVIPWDGVERELTAWNRDQTLRSAIEVSAVQAAVREILIRDQGPTWVLGHETGTALAAEPVLGWLVGYSEHNGNTWVFALNIDLDINPNQSTALDNQLDPLVRQRLATTLLVRAGALPEEALT